MVQVRGKVIALVCSRVQGAAELKQAARAVVHSSTGFDPEDLSLEGWYRHQDLGIHISVDSTGQDRDPRSHGNQFDRDGIC